MDETQFNRALHYTRVALAGLYAVLPGSKESKQQMQSDLSFLWDDVTFHNRHQHRDRVLRIRLQILSMQNLKPDEYKRRADQLAADSFVDIEPSVELSK